MKSLEFKVSRKTIMSNILVLFLFVYGRASSDWIDDALTQFTSLCGSQLCNGTFNGSTEAVNPEHEALSSACPTCFCSNECIKNKNCCPDILLRFPVSNCIETMIYHPYKNSSLYDTTDPYKIVKSCPVDVSENVRTKCTTYRNISERMQLLPETSLETFLTYDNRYCAECNNDAYNTELWYLDLQFCAADFNVVNSIEEMIQLSYDNTCRIKTISQSFVESCKEQSHDVISNCNKTGSWKHWNEAVERACKSVDQPLGMFKNIFCYICNPPNGNTEIISSCPAGENVYNEPCINGSYDGSTYPYKNKYCFLCNINETIEIVHDVHYDINVLSKNFKYYIVSHYCKEGFSIQVFDHTSVYYKPDPVIEEDILWDSSALSFYRLWQYEIVCPTLEVFGLFSTIDQIKYSSERKGCLFKQISRNVSMQCSQEQHLIRVCNNTNLRNNCFGGCNNAIFTYTDRLIETACLSVESYKLIGYKGYYNIFCYMCNQADGPSLRMICYNEDFLFLFNINRTDCRLYPKNENDMRYLICALCWGSGFINPSYSFVFRLSTYRETVPINKDLDLCTSKQIYDEKKKMCRDLKCGPGKILSNDKCISLLHYTNGLRYTFAVGMHITVLEKYSDIAGDILQTVMFELSNYFERKLNGTMILADSVYIITNIACSEMQTSSQFSGNLYLSIATSQILFVDRLQIEQTLINFLHTSFVINTYLIRLKIVLFEDNQSFQAPLLFQSLSFTNKCLYHTNMGYRNLKYSVALRVNELLLCTQIEIEESEYTHESYQRIRFDGCLLDSNEFILMSGKKARICKSKFLKITADYKDSSESFDLLVLETFCNILSIICLLVTLLTYLLFKTLRTVPGQSNMILISALLLNSILYQVRLHDIQQDGILCQTMAILQHYSLLTVFTAYNVCAFHAYRVFCGNYSIKTLTSNPKTVCKYTMYVSITPAVMIISNVIVTFIATDHTYIGYGGDICFLSLKYAAIFTFIVPIGLILLSNLLMFLVTIRHICKSPHVSSDQTSREKRNYLAIYLKLFTISGCSWIFQVVDSVLPGLVFSELIYLCNLLTGLFVFMSCVCNMRVIKLYRQRFCGYDDSHKSCSAKSNDNTKSHANNTSDQTERQENDNKIRNYTCKLTYNTKL